MAKKKVYCGRFISTPMPTELSIKLGAVLVTTVGVIERVWWDAEDEVEGRLRIELDEEVDFVKAENVENGFFFPGFIGMLFS